MGLEALFSLEPSVVIEYMNSLFGEVFRIAGNPIMQEWGNGVINGVAEDTERKAANQLGYNPTK